MIYPVKIMDAKGKIKEEKCLTGQQAVDHYWVDKFNKKTNSEIFALSVHEKLLWKRLNLDDKIPVLKPWSYLRPHQKARPEIHQITCHNTDCGKVVMKTMARAKYCCLKCQHKQAGREQYQKRKLQKREKQNEIERKGIQA